MTNIAKTPAILSSEILLKSSGFSGVFLLVEGDFDQRFWANHIYKQHVKLINCVGKPNVIGALELSKNTHQSHRFLALADKDYDVILNQLKSYPELIYTDENDLELTLLLCPPNYAVPFLETILQQSVDVQKRQLFEATVGHSLVEHLRIAATNYGVLRLINQDLQCGVDFDRLPILHSDFFDHTSLHQDIAALTLAFFNEVVQVGKVRLTLLQLNGLIQSKVSIAYSSSWGLAQGHDVVKLVATAINSTSLRPASNFTKASEISLARDLCLLVNNNELKKTTMYQKICAYQKSAGFSGFQ
jgi:hypothetical protein